MDYNTEERLKAIDRRTSMNLTLVLFQAVELIMLALSLVLTGIFVVGNRLNLWEYLGSLSLLMVIFFIAVRQTHKLTDRRNK